MNLFGIGTGEILLILVIAALVVGPERMVELARQMGLWLRKFRETTQGVTEEFREAFSLEELEGGESEAGEEAAISAGGDGSQGEVESAEAVAEIGPPPAEGAALPAPDDIAEREAALLKASLEAKLVDGEIETDMSPKETVVSEEGGLAEGDRADAEPTVVELAEFVPEEVEVKPTLVEQAVVVADEGTADDAAEDED